MGDRPLLHTVVAAISDGTAVDWSASERAASSPAERALLDELKAIAAATVVAPQSAPPANASDQPRLLGRLLLALAAVKTVLAVPGWWALHLHVPAEARATSAYIANVAVFGFSALALFAGSRRDLCAVWLGALFLLIASSFSDRLLLGLLTGAPWRPLIVVVRSLPTEAFLTFALWQFVWSFPAPPLRARDRRTTAAFVRLSLAMGVALFLVSVLLLFDRGDGRLHDALGAASPLTRAGWAFWPVLLALAVPALGYLVWKTRFEAREQRNRAALLAKWLALGVAPMALVAAIAPWVPVVNDARYRTAVGILVYVPLLAIAPATAYAVLVHGTIEVPLVISRAMQHRVVRRIVWVAGLGPIGYAVVFAYIHRASSLTDLMLRRQSIALLALPLLGVLALTFHTHLLRSIDRRFLAATPDYAEVLARLERSLRDAHGVRDVVAVTVREVERAFQPHRVAVLLADDSGSALVSPLQDVPPLRADSTIAGLLQAAREEIYLGVDSAGPVIRLLPDDEQRWVTNAGVQLMVRLVGSSGTLLGTIVLGEKRGGLPFSVVDRTLLAVMASHAALVLENRCLFDVPFRHLVKRSDHRGLMIDWDDEPAAECERCNVLWPSRTTICPGCRRPMVSAPLPLIIGGKLRVEGKIGAGGMGVVYRAVDLVLDRKVAIKTLSRLSSARADRLRHEARAMASVLHPNLAIIYGIEEWRGAPLLVVEYLGGGTLANRLRRGRLEIAETLDIGITLADVLDRVHGSGVLHRDIKPTNIGFAHDGTPKLLDFGVASMIEASVTAPAISAVLPTAHLAVVLSEHLVGTLLYLCPDAFTDADPSPAFDLWSLSLMLYEAIAGEHPFATANSAAVLKKVRKGIVPDIRTFNSGCSPDVAAFFESALHRDPTKRPNSAAELRSRLRWLRAT